MHGPPALAPAGLLRQRCAEPLAWLRLEPLAGVPGAALPGIKGLPQDTLRRGTTSQKACAVATTIGLHELILVKRPNPQKQFELVL